MKHSSAVVPFALLVLSAAALQACGGAADAPRAPESRALPEPATVEEAQAQIDRARAELAQGGPGAAAPGGGAAATGAADSSSPKKPAAEPPAPPPPATPSKAAAPAARPGAESTSDSAVGGPRVEDRCASPCRALVSMRRAVSALCRMTGGDDTRCVDAKKTLSESEGRVSPCSC